MFRGMPSLCPEILSRALVSEQLWSCITRSSKSVLDVSNATAIYFKPALEITTESIAAYDKAYPPK